MILPKKHKLFIFFLWLNILLLLSLPKNIHAESLSKEEAVNIACNFFKTNGYPCAQKDFELFKNGPTTKGKETDSSLYILINKRSGFIIVAGNKDIPDILAYSFFNSFPEEDLPPALIEYLKNAKNIIRQKTLKTNHQTKTLQNNQKVDTIKLITAQWHQKEPYNNLCPIYNDKHCVVGCVPLAFAIIMRYHKWPQKTSNYKIESYKTYCSNIDIQGWTINYEYDWDNMPLSNGKEYNESQKKAVSILTRDIGALIKAEYEIYSGQTGATLTQYWKLMDAYGYDKEAYFTQKAYYEEKQWLNLLKQNLNNNLPIIYGAQSNEAGHAFIVDGYDSADRLSINWGWGGDYNGYYTLNPENTSPSAPQYLYGQHAVLGLQPNHNGKWHTTVTINNSMGSMQIPNNVIKKEESFIIANINPSVDTHNKFFSDEDPENPKNNTEFIFALIDKNRTIKEYISNTFDLNYLLEKELSGPRNPITNHSQSYNRQIECIINTDINYGDMIELYYRTKNNNEQWTPVSRTLEHNEGCIPLKEEQTLEEKTKILLTPNKRQYNWYKPIHEFSLLTKPGTTIKLYNEKNILLSTGGSSSHDEYGNKVTQGSTASAGYNRLPDTAQSLEIVIGIDDLSTGKYKIVLKYGLEDKIIWFEL